MKFEELLQLVEAVSRSKLTELKYEKDDEKVCLRKQGKGSRAPAGVVFGIFSSRSARTGRYTRRSTVGEVTDSQKSVPEQKKCGEVPAGRYFLCGACRGCVSYVKVRR